MNYKNRKIKKSFWINFCYFFIGVFILIFIYSITTIYSKNYVIKTVNETLDMVKDRCIKYDNYNNQSKINDLFLLQTKANFLKSYISPEKLEDNNFIQAFIKAENLTGIIILDENLKPLIQSDADSLNYFQDILNRENIKNILENPKKLYMDCSKIKSKEYNYVVLARENKKGLILCYNDNSKKIKPTKTNIISFDNLLTDFKFKLDAVLVITDKEKIISSNEKSLQGLKISECPVYNTNHGIWHNQKIVTLKYNSMLWHGNRVTCKDYNIYAFFPHNSVYRLSFNISVFSTILFLLLFLFFLFLQQKKYIVITVKNMNKFDKADRLDNSSLELNSDLNSKNGQQYQQTNKKHILLVEDNELNKEITEFLLENQGSLVTTAINNQKAMELFIASEINEYQAILIDLDITDAELNGMKMAEIIKNAKRADSNNIKIIAMTENISLINENRFIDEYIIKPINEETLKKAFGD